MLSPLVLYALLPVLLWAGFRVGRWFGTSYDTNAGHYVVIVVMVCGAIYIVSPLKLSIGLWKPPIGLWWLSLFAGFYAGLFIGGHHRLWAKEEHSTADRR